MLQLMAKVVQKVRWIYILWYIFLILLSVAWYRSDKFQWRWWKWGQFFLRFAESSCYDDKIFPSYFICKILLFTFFFFLLVLKSLEVKAQKALECPCVADLRKGPCGNQFSEAFVCFIKSTAKEKVIMICKAGKFWI